MKVMKAKRRPNQSCLALVMAVAMAMQEAPAPWVDVPGIAYGF